MSDPQIKTRLWETANILHGFAADRTDWNGCILPLLFFNRISEVWDEVTASATELCGDAVSIHFEEVDRVRLLDQVELGANVEETLSVLQNQFPFATNV